MVEEKEAKEKINFVKQGRLNRAAGARFELKVRADLEKNGWIADKWTNNVDLELGKLMKARRKMNFFSNMRIMGIGTGFPDFIGFRREEDGRYEVIGIEVKMKGLLDKIEKEKCQWLLDQKIFSRILIAKHVKEGTRVKIEYIDFEKKYNKSSPQNIKTEKIN